MAVNQPFQNFGNMLSGGSTQGATFRRVLSWTLVWAFFSTFSSYFVGMLLAMLINARGIRFKPLFRTLLIATIAVPQFVSLLTMRTLLQGQGFVNDFLMQLFNAKAIDVNTLLRNLQIS